MHFWLEWYIVLSKRARVTVGYSYSHDWKETILSLHEKGRKAGAYNLSKISKNLSLPFEENNKLYYYSIVGPGIFHAI